MWLRDNLKQYRKMKTVNVMGDPGPWHYSCLHWQRPFKKLSSFWTIVRSPSSGFSLPCPLKVFPFAVCGAQYFCPLLATHVCSHGSFVILQLKQVIGSIAGQDTHGRCCPHSPWQCKCLELRKHGHSVVCPWHHKVLHLPKEQGEAQVCG